MKTLLTFLVLLFSSSVLADDISDFEIEGMSIGDSLLDYMTEKEITNSKKVNYKDNKYKFAYFNSKVNSIYNHLQIGFKTNDKNYKIELLSGILNFKNNVKDCWKKQDEISNELDNLFSNSTKEDTGKIKRYPEDDPTGALFRYISYFFDSGGTATVYCSDYSKKSGLYDNLKVQVVSSKMKDYLTEKEY